MTWAIITEVEQIPDEIKQWFETSPLVQKVATEAEALELSGWNYIKTNGLQAGYQLAVELLTGAATGTPWLTLGADLLAKAEAAGIAILKGAESILLAQAQSDLIAAGQLIAPTTGAIVGAAPAPTEAVPTEPAPAA